MKLKMIAGGERGVPPLRGRQPLRFPDYSSLGLPKSTQHWQLSTGFCPKCSDYSHSEFTIRSLGYKDEIRNLTNPL